VALLVKHKPDDQNLLRLKWHQLGGSAVGNGGSNACGFGMRYLLTDGDAKILLEKMPTKVRVYIKDGYFEGEINNKNAERIAKAMSLIIN
jgi:hypothetical protein